MIGASTPRDDQPGVLGGPDAAQPIAFNVGLMLTGAIGVAGAIGMATALQTPGKNTVVALMGGFTGLSLLFASVGLAMGGSISAPQPTPLWLRARHFRSFDTAPWSNGAVATR